MVKLPNSKFNEGLAFKISFKISLCTLLYLVFKYYFRFMIAPEPGILLIADPFLKDPNFLRTVVLLCDHKDEGSFGFVLNKQIEQTLDELLENFEGFELPVYYGGPVNMDTVHFLHQYPEQIPDSQEVMKGVYWGGNFEVLTTLVKNNVIDFSKIRHPTFDKQNKEHTFV